MSDTDQEATMTRKVTLRKNAPSRYTVLVDGQEIGEVYKDRSTTMHQFSGRMYGYETARTTWSWQSTDLCGDFELETRRAAVEDLVAFAVATGNV